MWGKKKKIKHNWEYLPDFHIVQGVVICIQVCKITNACRYVRVPSIAKLEEMENQE